MAPRLLLDGRDPGWPVQHGCVIGRSPEADVTLGLDRLSRRHARIDADGDRWRVFDLASTNGTFLDGEEVGEAGALLGDGSRLVLGGVATLTFLDDQATRPGPRLGRLTGVWIDPTTDAVWVDAIRLEPPLSARQLDLLRLLVRCEGEVVDRPTVVAEVWADVAADGVSDDAVTALIKRLRSRVLETSPTAPTLEIVRGRGIRLPAPETP